MFRESEEKPSTQTTADQEYTFSYNYNADGTLEQQTYPSGRVVDYDYDPAGRAKFAKDQAKAEKYISMETSNAYWPHGAVKDARLGNGRWEHSIFNNRLQPIQTGLGATQGSSSLLRLNLTYGTTSNNGNLLTQTITAPGLPAPLTQSYTYDGVNRLLSAAETGSWSRIYGYDAFGNRAATGSGVDVNTPQSTSDFDAASNRLTSAYGATYDAAGDLVSFDRAGSLFDWTAAYDADNKQLFYCQQTTAACSSANATAGYVYDGEGRRVKKVKGNDTTVFVYDAFGNLGAEYATTLSQGLTAGTFYRTLDHLGSTRVISDQSGAVVERRDFFPFGEETPANASHGNRQLVTDGGPSTTYNQNHAIHQKFTGKERDDESRLDYFGASLSWFSRNGRASVFR